ncbi:hypothetical protein DL93DRAFT_2090003 [Clavulina sp. PMI_390]|nr:hypothetical protein DL93DRAFT_2090003 [Clavulina sp. PMI_390]
MDEFTTSESVLNYLSTIVDGAFIGDSCSRLSGGFGNFVWRVQLKNSYQRMSSVILKHGKDYAAASREISFPLDRMAFELDALNIFSSIFPSTNIHDDMPSVRVPRVLHADLESHVLIIEDAGDHPSLKTFLSASPPHPSATSISIDVGKALGTFLRTLHELGRNNTTYRRLFSNNTTARNLCAWRDAGRLEQAVQQYGGSEYLNATREIDGFIQSAIHKSEETFNMGDFW